MQREYRASSSQTPTTLEATLDSADILDPREVQKSTQGPQHLRKVFFLILVTAPDCPPPHAHPSHILPLVCPLWKSLIPTKSLRNSGAPSALWRFSTFTFPRLAQPSQSLWVQSSYLCSIQAGSELQQSEAACHPCSHLVHLAWSWCLLQEELNYLTFNICFLALTPPEWHLIPCFPYSLTTK